MWVALQSRTMEARRHGKRRGLSPPGRAGRGHSAFGHSNKAAETLDPWPEPRDPSALNSKVSGTIRTGHIPPSYHGPRLAWDHCHVRDERTQSIDGVDTAPSRIPDLAIHDYQVAVRTRTLSDGAEVA